MSDACLQARRIRNVRETWHMYRAFPTFSMRERACYSIYAFAGLLFRPKTTLKK
jgi:hypothetical protein